MKTQRNSMFLNNDFIEQEENCQFKKAENFPQASLMLKSKN